MSSYPPDPLYGFNRSNSGLSRSQLEQARSIGCLIWIIILVVFAVALWRIYKWKTESTERAEELTRATKEHKGTLEDLQGEHARELKELEERYTRQVAELRHTLEEPPASKEAEDFWPDKVLSSAAGYLTTEKYIPLRAIAKRPNIPLFNAAAREYPMGVVGIMRPWQPYYVLKRERDALELGGERLGGGEDERYWVAAGACFCWTTRECLNIEDPTPIFRTLEDAKANANAIEPAYTYPFVDHFIKDTDTRKKRPFEMAALPVLARSDLHYWRFVRAEGGEQGYEPCWLRWDGEEPSVALRIRTGRNELETYLAGLQYLLALWKNPGLKDKAHLGIYDLSLDHLEKREVPGVSTIKRLKARREGIARPSGVLEPPIESELQYQKVSRRAVKLLDEWSSNEDVWDADEVSWLPAHRLP